MTTEGNRRIIQVVPRLIPLRCGVSDHALLLAEKLRNNFSIDTAFVVLNSDERASVPFPVVHCAPQHLLATCQSFSGNQPDAVLVHLSGYGYAADGAPAQLAAALDDVKTDGGFRIAVFFHELSASGMPWTSAFWHAGRQKQILRRIAAASDLLVTNTRIYADWLERKTARRAGATIEYMPVFSQVGEDRQHVLLADGDRIMAVFGLGATRRKAYEELRSLDDMLRRLGVRQIVDIGPEFEPSQEVAGIPVERMGVLAAADVSRQLSRSTFGFAWCNPLCLAKSGVFAGYSAHGVIPVIGQPFRGEIDGLRDGVQVLSPRTAKALEPAGLEACSLAAWRWYSGHRALDHATLYDRWLGAAHAAGQNAERKHA